MGFDIEQHWVVNPRTRTQLVLATWQGRIQMSRGISSARRGRWPALQPTSRWGELDRVGAAERGPAKTLRGQRRDLPAQQPGKTQYACGMSGAECPIPGAQTEDHGRLGTPRLGYRLIAAAGYLLEMLRHRQGKHIEVVEEAPRVGEVGSGGRRLGIDDGDLRRAVVGTLFVVVFSGFLLGT